MKQTILKFIFDHARQTPDKLCIADKFKSITYNELCVKIRSIAKYLYDNGVEKGDVVGLRSVQTVEFVAGFFGIQYMGAVVCPIEKTASKERTQEVLKQISSKYILDVVDFDLLGVKSLDINIGFNYSGMLSECVNIKDDDISDIIFTTGTTGKSKGILVSYKADVAIAENVIDSVSMNENEVELITSPTSHSLAIRRINAAMYIGSSVILSENFLLYENFWGLVDKYHVTAITFVPAILNLILEAYKNKLGDYDHQLNYIQLGSAPLHEALKEKLISLLPTTRLYNTYGATESGCTIILEFSTYSNKPGCIGRTTINTKLFFTDETRMSILNAVDDKTAGYLAFVGDMNMTGYINDPIQTAEVLKDGVIYTNDIGYLGEDGLVYLLGRVGEIINSGGLKINPVEIEEVVCKIDGIKDCACVPMKDKRRGETPKLFVVFEEGAMVDNKEIKDYIKQYLEDYKIPARIQQIDEIPRTFNGKIIRKQLIEDA